MSTITQNNSSALTKIGMGIDPHAVLYKDESRMLRAINPRFSQFYSDLVTQPFIKELIAERLLIQTERSTARIEGHDVVLEHPRLTYVTYPFEWTPSMFKQAATTILKLNIKLMQHGYCTQDAHPWNVLFDGPDAKFIDFTSIIKVPEDGGWRALSEFNNYCTNSLLLMSKGLHTVARAMLREIFSFPDSDLINALPFNTPKNSSRSLAMNELKRMADMAAFFGSRAQKHLRRKFATSNTTNDVKALTGLLEKIMRLNVEPKHAEWSNYYSGVNELPIYNGDLESLERARKSSPKHMTIDRLLSQIKPKTVLDIGCNRGLYSQMAASYGAKAVGIDMDELALNQMYLDAKSLGTQVIPLYVNSVAPAEAVGFKEMQFPTVTERLRSDCVLCLALVHHLVFKRTQMDFAHIAQALSSFTKQHLIVEFVPREDKHVNRWFNENYEWYTCNNFRDELLKHFATVEVFESFPSPRLLLYCKGK